VRHGLPLHERTDLAHPDELLRVFLVPFQPRQARSAVRAVTLENHLWIGSDTIGRFRYLGHRDGRGPHLTLRLLATTNQHRPRMRRCLTALHNDSVDQFDSAAFSYY
jgi:hypothetical protein